MTESMDLKVLEKKAYRSTFQDGLWDLYLAGIMACLGILGMISKVRDNTWIWLLGYTLLIGGVLALFMLAKKYITIPRLGNVKFGVKRKRRKMILVGILSITVLLNIWMVLITMGTIEAPSWLQKFGSELTGRGIMDIFVPLFAGLFITIVMSLIAYFIEFYRGMYIAVLFGLGVFIDLFFDLPVVLVVGAVLAAIPGLILLIRFIRRYPIQSGEVDNGNLKAS